MADAGEPLCSPWLGIQGQGWLGRGVHDLHAPMETVQGDGPGAVWCGHAQLDVRHVGPPCRFRFPAAGDHRCTCVPFTAANIPTLLLGIKVEKIVLLLWRFLAWRNCGGKKRPACICTDDTNMVRRCRPNHTSCGVADVYGCCDFELLEIFVVPLSTAVAPSPLHADRSHGRPCVMQFICATARKQQAEGCTTRAGTPPGKSFYFWRSEANYFEAGNRGGAFYSINLLKRSLEKLNKLTHNVVKKNKRRKSKSKEVSLPNNVASIIDRPHENESKMVLKDDTLDDDFVMLIACCDNYDWEDNDTSYNLENIYGTNLKDDDNNCYTIDVIHTINDENDYVYDIQSHKLGDAMFDENDMFENLFAAINVCPNLGDAMLNEDDLFISPTLNDQICYNDCMPPT